MTQKIGVAADHLLISGYKEHYGQSRYQSTSISTINRNRVSFILLAVLLTFTTVAVG